VARRLVVPAALVFVAACGSTPEPTTTPDSTQDTGADHRGPTVGVEADIGALNEGQVTATFQKSQGALGHCMDKGREKLPYLAGTVHFKVRVGSSGKANEAHLTTSTLGDRDTEACMLDALRAASWPEPVGGREGIAETEFTFDPEGSVRMPVDWDQENAGKNVQKAKAAISKCRSSSGASVLVATVYVETDGSVLAVGVSGDDGAEKAAPCVVRALKEVKFNSPGSFAAKLVLGDS
jgi:hypothetical protein